MNQVKYHLKLHFIPLRYIDCRYSTTCSFNWKVIECGKLTFLFYVLNQPSNKVKDPVQNGYISKCI